MYLADILLSTLCIYPKSVSFKSGNPSISKFIDCHSHGKIHEKSKETLESFSYYCSLLLIYLDGLSTRSASLVGPLEAIHNRYVKFDPTKKDIILHVSIEKMRDYISTDM